MPDKSLKTSNSKDLRRAAAFVNNGLKLSGEVGRFEVEVQLTPPADR